MLVHIVLDCEMNTTRIHNCSTNNHYYSGIKNHLYITHRIVFSADVCLECWYQSGLQLATFTPVFTRFSQVAPGNIATDMQLPNMLTTLNWIFRLKWYISSKASCFLLCLNCKAKKGKIINFQIIIILIAFTQS